MNTKPKVADLLTKIQNQIEANSKPQTKIWTENHMLHFEKYRGMLQSEVKSIIFKDMWASELKDLDLNDQKELAHELLRQGYGEDKYLGTLIFDKIKSSIEIDDIKKVENLFKDGTIKGWAGTDNICATIFKPWVTGNEENMKYICEWKNSDCLWLQRSSCVVFVALAKHGDKEPNFKGFTDRLLETCETTIKNQEKYVQLGTGWLLRIIGTQYKKKLTDFIEKYIEYFTRDGLRYAVEKLDDKTKKKMMSLKGKKDLDELEREVEQEGEEGVKKRKKRK